MNFIKRAFKKKRERKYPILYVAVDLHETIITPTYKKNNDGATLYPGAVEVLSNWTKRPDVKLILWTSSHSEPARQQARKLAEHGILFDAFNINPNEPSTDLCDFSKKFYFDILLDDKANFDAETDWLKIKETLIELGEW